MRQWILDARAHGFPVVVTGVVLFQVVLGLHPLLVLVLIAVPMMAIETWAAWLTFVVPYQEGREDWSDG
jgi:hypothetical protein